MNSNRLRWIPRLLGKIALATTVVLFAGIALEIVSRMMPQSFFPDTEATSDRSLAYAHSEDSRVHPWVRGATNFLRVAVIGDSFTQAAGVQPDDAYGPRLERLLNMNDGVRPAAVHVFAKCGTSTFMQLGLLREALEWQPQVVILGICLNDMEDYANPADMWVWRDATIPHKPGRLLQPLTQRSRALAWVYRQKEYIRCRPAFVDYYRRIYNPDYAGWGRSTHALELFRNDCANEGAAFGAIIFPLLSEGCEKNRYPFDFVHEALHARLDALGVPYLDLLETFRGKMPVRMQAMPNVDVHPSEIAHRMAAEALLVWLMDRNFITSEYAPRRITRNEHTVWRMVRERMLLMPAPAGTP